MPGAGEPWLVFRSTVWFVALDTWEQIGLHLQEVAAGNPEAWEQLLALLSPLVERCSRAQPIGRLRDDEDAVRDIVAKVIAKLHANEHRTIKKFVEKEDPPPLEAWIRVLVRSAAIDVMRAHPEFVRGSKKREPGWLSLATLVTREGPAPNTLAAKQREVETFLAQSMREAREELERSPSDAAANLAAAWKIPVLHTRRLVKRVDVYERVLDHVLAGPSYVEVAAELRMSRREVELVVGYIEEFFHCRGFAAEG